MNAPVHRPAGIHLLADFHGIDPALLTATADIDALLRSGAAAAGARILHSHFHSFGDTLGVTGVVLLAESHISIHTWPEYGFAAADIFMCGDAQPQLALQVIEQALKPASRVVQTIERGVATTVVPAQAGIQVRAVAIG
ncbi:adenosylmethionine decarboxylase [Massilia antarctica]|uniref:S-adenosylmethionine decarboxylase proenzyme n=1 Tax=Massilia antarctica TaxID=2765360 RepID=A0AA48WKV9_9BURK|nr:adenosylmethionine decarboxylase [Massilia antarctica]QPI52795.1 adenosylmethionine decarboxylase [Massilia antarctica]